MSVKFNPRLTFVPPPWIVRLNQQRECPIFTPSLDELRRFETTTYGRGARILPHILLVEDQRFYQQLFRTVLPMEYHLHHAANAAEGWQYYLDHAPDIAFIDVEMPGLDGHILAAGIRALDRNAFTVMVTANCDEGTVARALENEVRGFITKPYSKKKVHDCIDIFMAERAGLEAGDERKGRLRTGGLKMEIKG